MGNRMKSTKIRWVYAAGAAVAVAGVIVASSLAANAGTRPAAQPDALLAAAAPAPSQPEGTLGDVIDTGSGDWVLYAKPVDISELPDIHFRIMEGHRKADGTLTDAVMANETEGSDRAPGFHAVQGSMEVEGTKTLTFGYYVGSATKITGTAHGKTVTAGQATWSEDPSVKVFWFDPAVSGVGHLAAYGADGKKLTTGNSGIGVG
jgi:hypothetical protein